MVLRKQAFEWLQEKAKVSTRGDGNLVLGFRKAYLI